VGAWLTLLSFTFVYFCFISLLFCRFFRAWLGNHNWKPPYMMRIKSWNSACQHLFAGNYTVENHQFVSVPSCLLAPMRPSSKLGGSHVLCFVAKRCCHLQPSAHVPQYFWQPDQRGLHCLMSPTSKYPAPSNACEELTAFRTHG
jgi:hypothetical protein